MGGILEDTNALSVIFRAMNQKKYFAVVSLIFLVIVVMHGLRVLNGWDAAIGGWSVPMWLSYVAIVLGAYLAWTGYHFRR